MNKVRCPGCRQYINRGTAIHVGLSWYCDDNCRFQHEYRQRKTKNREPSPNRTTTEPSSSKKKYIHQRDGETCRCCGQIGVHIHHINYRSEGGGHSEYNLILLCGGCHDLVHSDKERYKPLLLGVIWEHYVNGRFVTAMQLERWLLRARPASSSPGSDR